MRQELNLTILCGLPFSGKSTYSRSLEDKNCIRISFDETWVKMESQGKNYLTWENVRQEIKSMIQKELLDENSVVYDDLNLAVEHRREILSIAKELNISTRIIFLDVKLTTIRKRQRDNDGKRHDVDEEKFTTAISQLEEPTKNEADDLIIVSVE